MLVAAWLTARTGAAIDIAPLNSAIAVWTPVVALIAVAEEVVFAGSCSTPCVHGVATGGRWP